MPQIRKIYRRLRTIDDPSVDRAMAAALTTADPQAVQLITLSLLERDRPEGTVSLVTHFHKLPENLQQTVVRQIQDLYRPLRENAGMNHTQARLNVVRIIQQAHATRLAYLVIGQLHRNDPQVRQAATDCILDLATWVDTSVETGPRSDAVSAEFLVTALGQAMETYASNECPAILLAAARLLFRPMPTVGQVLAGPKQPAMHAMRSLIEENQHPDHPDHPQTGNHPEIRRAMLWLLQVPTMADSVISVLPQIVANGELGDVLYGSHLLLDHHLRYVCKSSTMVRC
jgi:hypothetical protein